MPLAFGWLWCDWQCWERASPLLKAPPHTVCVAFGVLALLAAVDVNETSLLHLAVNPNDAVSPTANLPRTLWEGELPTRFAEVSCCL